MNKKEFAESLLSFSPEGVVSTDFTHRVTNDVTNVYRENYFGSCMQNSRHTAFYDLNPDVVSVVEISRGRYEVARALLWKTDVGYLLDRVYPNDEQNAISYIHKVAKKEGWDVRAGQDFASPLLGQKEHLVRVPDCSFYPWLDSMRFSFKTEPGEGEGEVVLTNSLERMMSVLPERAYPIPRVYDEEEDEDDEDERYDE